MNKPVLLKQEISRLPFRRRPVAEPGTKLVFQMPSGELVAPDYPYTSGDVWWRGPRIFYVVDTRPHPELFESPLPAKGDLLSFGAAIRFSWQVHEPITVVSQLVEDVVSVCRSYLVDEMRRISRRFTAGQSEDAEDEILAQFRHKSIPLPSGLTVSGIGVELKVDEQHKTIATDIQIHELKQQLAEVEEVGRVKLSEMSQTADLRQHKERADFFAKLLAAGGASMAGNILAQDPARAGEAANFMVNLWQQDQDVALQAMRVILEGDHVRLGEIDPAIAAAVERFTALMSQAGSRLAPNAALTAAPASTSNAEEPAHISDEEPT